MDYDSLHESWVMDDAKINDHKTRICLDIDRKFGIQVCLNGNDWWWLVGRYDSERDAIDGLLIRRLSI